MFNKILIYTSLSKILIKITNYKNAKINKKNNYEPKFLISQKINLKKNRNK